MTSQELLLALADGETLELARKMNRKATTGLPAGQTSYWA